ncbi:hypothetical protein VTN02DRAFT_6078 [Thermoascus thermophilus]
MRGQQPHFFHRMISSFKSEAATNSRRHCLASSRLLSCPDRQRLAALRSVFVAHSGSSTIIVVADSQLSLATTASGAHKTGVYI